MLRFMMATLLLASEGALSAETSVERLGWLTGCWKAPSADFGSEEIWTSPAGGSMFGLSRTIRRGKLVEFEFMRIQTLEDGTLAFLAQPSGVAPTTFRLKSLDSASVVFENLGHDFPQRVIYSRVAAGRISARIEGLENGVLRGIDFPLLRAECRDQLQKNQP